MKKLFSVAEYLMVIVTIIKCFLEKKFFGNIAVFDYSF